MSKVIHSKGSRSATTRSVEMCPVKYEGCWLELGAMIVAKLTVNMQWWHSSIQQYYEHVEGLGKHT